MDKFVYAERVVEAIRKLLKSDSRFTKLLMEDPIISVGPDYRLHEIVWVFPDCLLTVSSRAMVFRGATQLEVIMGYSGFDDILRKAGVAV